ncbi:Nse4 C-terminal-domain-containing protein [Filobasidium floriforme]|uniref:Nse4 C-terminal-domain-containing protein n=1 Tax=Filobasidium floriforme TaxID=5210 RepID=UPI001E8E2F70|nr:Nse4 C-terminal-domain-containing protein [Filobasidium floriforme]KAH8090648.1 Nse4 C-terminal-domain-containing protein [Filobasidium floriforme]
MESEEENGAGSGDEIVNGRDGGMPRESQYTEPEAKEKMRGLRAELEEDNRDPSKLTMKKVVQQLDLQQEYYAAGKNTESRIMDAGNLLLVSENLHRLSKKERANANAYDINEFLEPLRSKLGFDLPTVEEEGEDNLRGIRKNGELGDWERIGWMATKRMRTVMGLESINGMMAVEHKKRVVKKRAKQAALGAEVRPTELREQDMAASKNETTENVKSVYKRLRDFEANDLPVEGEYGGVNFYEWIINPESFSETVENLFYTSFLVREGKLVIDIDDEGIPRLYDALAPLEDGTEPDPIPNTAPKIQEVLQFDMDTWKEAIRLFNITKPMIPARGPVNTQKDSWAV